MDWFQLSKTGTITGLENSDEIKINLTATPLPFTESTVIKSESNKLISSIAVFNLEGVELFTKSNLQSTSVEFGNQLSSGMYFVAVKSGNMTEVIKIIKN